MHDAHAGRTGGPGRGTRGRGSRSSGAALAALVAVAVLAACTGSPSRSVTGAAGTMSLLFVQTAQSGSLDRVAGSTEYDLRLRGVDPNTSWFSDRPQRQAGTQATATMMGDWDAYGFGADPPNAALVLTDHPKTEDTVIVELRDPRYDEAARELQYRVRVLDSPRDGLESAKGQTPPQIPATFAASSLFIDDASVSATTTAGNDLRASSATTGTAIAGTSPTTAKGASKASTATTEAAATTPTASRAPIVRERIGCPIRGSVSGIGGSCRAVAGTDLGSTDGTGGAAGRTAGIMGLGETGIREAGAGEAGVGVP